MTIFYVILVMVVVLLVVPKSRNYLFSKLGISPDVEGLVAKIETVFDNFFTTVENDVDAEYKKLLASKLVERLEGLITKLKSYIGK